MDSLLIILSGLTAASVHVFSGPDHLASLTPIAVEVKKKAWYVGFLWGIGNLSGMLLLATIFLLFKTLLPINKISEISEQLVGVVLCAVGISAVYKAFKNKKPLNDNRVNQNQVLLSLSIGLIHGLAGFSHFILLLPVLSFESWSQGVQYVIGFSVGTVVSMILYAGILGLLVNTKRNVLTFIKVIRIVGGVIAFLVGVYWLQSTVF